MSLENLLRINVENPLAGFQTRSSLLGPRPNVEVKLADPVEPTLKPLEISAVFLTFGTSELVDGPPFDNLGLEIRAPADNLPVLLLSIPLVSGEYRAKTLFS